MNRTAVRVLCGMSSLSDDVPATCTPLEGGPPSFGYMTREHAALFDDHAAKYFWAEWNGASYDLIEQMTDAEIGEIPF